MPAPAPALWDEGITVAESERQRENLVELGLSFENYKRGVLRQPYVAEFAPSGTTSASEYLRKRFGDFTGAKTIETTSTQQQALVGVKQLTLGDLKFIQRRIKETINQIINIRSIYLPIQTKLTQLNQISAELDNIIGAVERKEMSLENVPIDPRAAQKFLDGFRQMDIMPPLLGTRRRSEDNVSGIETDYSNEGIVLGPSQASAMAPSQASAMAPSPTFSREAEAKQLIYDNIQYARWSAEMNMDPQMNQHNEINKRLKNMDERLFTYMTSETPMPADVYLNFKQEIDGIKSAIEKN